MKKILLVLVTIFGLSCFLNAQSFQNPFPDTNDVTELGSSKQHHLDLKNQNKLKSANELVYLLDSIHGLKINADSVWEGTFKIDLTYDEHGNLIGYLEKDWNDDAADFLTGYNDVWIYNENNIESEYYFMKWNKASSNWDSVRYEKYSYDERGNKTEIISQNWKSEYSDWANTWLHLYEYDVEDNMTRHYLKQWNAENAIWENYYLYTHEYNLIGFVTESIQKDIARGDSTWRNRKMSSYVYDSNNLIELERKKWDSTNEIWINEDLSTYTYGANGLLDEKVWKKWNVSDSVYNFYNLFLYEYDEYGNEIEHQQQRWDTENLVWKGYRKELNYYSQHDVTAAKILDLENSIIIYPNPAENEISLSNITELSTVSIHDINGKLFIQRKVNTNNEVINVSQLPAGLYLLKISNQSGQQVAKFVKQ